MKSQNNNQQGVSFLPKILHFSTPVDTSGEVNRVSNEIPFFHTSSGVSRFDTKREPCKYLKSICPDNIPKYSMKCIFNNKNCRIKKYFDRFNNLDVGVGC